MNSGFVIIGSPKSKRQSRRRRNKNKQLQPNVPTIPSSTIIIKHLQQQKQKQAAKNVAIKELNASHTSNTSLALNDLNHNQNTKSVSIQPNHQLELNRCPICHNTQLYASCHNCNDELAECSVCQQTLIDTSFLSSCTDCGKYFCCTPTSTSVCGSRHQNKCKNCFVIKEQNQLFHCLQSNVEHIFENDILSIIHQYAIGFVLECSNYIKCHNTIYLEHSLQFNEDFAYNDMHSYKYQKYKYINGYFYIINERHITNFNIDQITRVLFHKYARVCCNECLNISLYGDIPPINYCCQYGKHATNNMYYGYSCDNLDYELITKVCYLKKLYHNYVTKARICGNHVNITKCNFCQQNVDIKLVKICVKCRRNICIECRPFNGDHCKDCIGFYEAWETHYAFGINKSEYEENYLMQCRNCKEFRNCNKIINCTNKRCTHRICGICADVDGEMCKSCIIKYKSNITRCNKCGWSFDKECVIKCANYKCRNRNVCISQCSLKCLKCGDVFCQNCIYVEFCGQCTKKAIMQKPKVRS